MPETKFIRVLKKSAGSTGQWAHPADHTILIRLMWVEFDFRLLPFSLFEFQTKKATLITSDVT